MKRRIEVGYVCRHGHFQFHDDPDGDSCGTKIIGTIYAKPIPEARWESFVEAVEYSMVSIHKKIEAWRKA